MPKLKVAITMDASLLRQVDESVRSGRFNNRSQAVEAAVAEQVDLLGRLRLARECGMLMPREEQQMADEAFVAGNEIWPEY